MNAVNDLFTLPSGFQALITAIFSLIVFFATRRHYAATQSAKLHDRLFELNKLTLQYPAVATAYDSMKSRETPYFAQALASEKADLYQQLRAYTYFRLNLYEEVFESTQGWLTQRTERGAAWGKYIEDRMAHALARELFNQNPKQFNAKFTEFVHRKK